MPISLSDTIDIRYRLQPEDLGGKSRPVLVRAVTLQGVETLTPLVHFEGLALPLALDLDQRIQIADIARSHLLVDWIGLPLVLRPESSQGFATIRLVSTTDRSSRPTPVPSSRWSSGRPNRRRIVRVVLVTLLLAAAYAAVRYVETIPALTTLQGLLGR